MSTVITALLIIISTIGIPLIFILIKRKKTRSRTKTFLKLFSEEGSKRGLSFSSHEVLIDKIIGLDGIRRSLLVFDFKNQEDVICIDIAGVKSCILEKNYDSIIIGTEKKLKLEPHLRSIDLKFSFKNNSQPVFVSFYDGNTNNIYEMAELEIKANRWETILCKMIEKEQKLRA